MGVGTADMSEPELDPLAAFPATAPLRSIGAASQCAHHASKGNACPIRCCNLDVRECKSVLERKEGPMVEAGRFAEEKDACESHQLLPQGDPLFGKRESIRGITAAKNSRQ